MSEMYEDQKEYNDYRKNAHAKGVNPRLADISYNMSKAVSPEVPRNLLNQFFSKKQGKEFLEEVLSSIPKNVEGKIIESNTKLEMSIEFWRNIPGLYRFLEVLYEMVLSERATVRVIGFWDHILFNFKQEKEEDVIVLQLQIRGLICNIFLYNVH